MYKKDTNVKTLCENTFGERKRKKEREKQKVVAVMYVYAVSV